MEILKRSLSTYFTMFYTNKNYISFVLGLLTIIIFGCQKQREEQSNSIPIDNTPAVSTIDGTGSTDSISGYTIGVPTITISPNGALTDPYTKKLKKLMIQENYVEALQLMPQVEKEFLAKMEGEKRDKSVAFFYIRGIYIYLYIMLDRVEEAYKTIKEMPIELSGVVPTYLIYGDNIHVLSRLNKTDEMIVEANKLLNARDTPLHLELFAFATLSVACLINNDNDKALEIIHRWEKRLRDTPPDTDESVKRGSVHSMFILAYFIEHLHNEYYVKIRVEKPEPPRVDPLDSEMIVFGRGDSSVTIVSRKDDTDLVDESMMKIIRERTVNFMQSSQQPPKSQ